MAPCGQMAGGAFHEVPPMMVNGGMPPVPSMDHFGGGYVSGGGYGGGYASGGYGCGGGGYGFNQQGGSSGRVVVIRRTTTRFTYPCGHPSCAPGRNSVMRR
jgi:hypothetical protein